MPERQPIPNINIGQVYDQRYADAEEIGRAHV